MRYDKEQKSTASIEFRVTVEEKQAIQEYCRSKHMTVSEFVRLACFTYMSQKEQ